MSRYAFKIDNPTGFNGTKGPWKVNYYGDIVGEDNRIVCLLPTYKESRMNAGLITQAKPMLSALQHTQKTLKILRERVKEKKIQKVLDKQIEENQKIIFSALKNNK
jgi:hypothetical protein